MEQVALDGVKVLEWSECVAGPFCSKLLADLGAEVIKVEKPRVGDISRRIGPFPNDFPHLERSALFLWTNTSKLGITLNVDDAYGRGIFLRLVEDVDILIEDKPMKVIEEMGLNYEHLKEVNPRLLFCSITPFGLSGPYRDYKAYPLNTFQSGGEGYITPGQTPFPERPPLKVGRFVGEYEIGTNTACAVLLALYYQRATGSGQMIDISKQEVFPFLNFWENNMYPNEGVIVNRTTRGYRIAGPIKCKDGYIEFCPHRDAEWERLIDWIGHPAWAQDESLKDEAGREKRGVELRKQMESWFSQYSKEEAYYEAQARHIPISPSNSVEGIVNSKQLNYRNYFVEVEHPETGKLKYPSGPCHLSETPYRIRHAPMLGEHNAEIFCNRLGYSKQELVKLWQTRVI